MEFNLKKATIRSDRLEFNSKFLEKYAQDSKDLEILIKFSYDKIFNKFLNLIEKSNFCTIKHQTSQENKKVKEKNAPKIVEEKKNQKIDQDEDKFKVPPVVEPVKNEPRIIEQKTTYADNQEQKRNDVNQLKDKFKKLNEEKLKQKDDDQVGPTDKKRLPTIVNKIVKNSHKDDEFSIKMHPPLATSSMLIPPSKEPDSKDKNSPKLDQLKTTISHEHASTLNQSGKVKQMVEMVEARMKDHSNNTPQFISKFVKNTNQISKNQNQPKEKLGVRLSNKYKNKKATTTIDQRKLRNSISNQEQKRKSIRKLNAFIKDISENSQVPAQLPIVKKPNIPIKVEPEKAVTTNHAASKIPTQSATTLLNAKAIKSNLISIQNSSSENKPENKNLLHPTVQNLYNVKPNEKSKFSKFLERNTPCKISKTELLAKEKKEMGRLNEREKLLNEKAEISKKKREEKMKKIAEIKHKNETELRKRQDEINSFKAFEFHDIKKKANESDKKLEESEKSNNILSHNSKEAPAPQPKTVHQLPDSLAGIVKNSPFIQKSESKFNPPVIQAKENKVNNHIQINNYSSPKPKIVPTTPHIKTESENSKTPTIQNTYKPKAQMNILKQIDTNHYCEPKQIKKEPEFENYSIHDLHSSDETDDDEEPNKPIPAWAKDPLFTKTAKNQSYKFINFTKLFRASAQNEINLDLIFKVKRKKFYERSSSANWNTSPIWNTSGIHGNESFRQLHK